MIIDEILDNYHARESWDKMSWTEKMACNYDRPIMDFRYIRDEAVMFGYDDIANAIHILPSGIIVNDGDELRAALHRYVDEGGYNPTIHVMVDKVEL